jgi:phosphoribosylformimino-5-aminoimidazole carboxamide ribotide isomerase
VEIIPAIDIRGGKVVRLSQGKFSEETVYADTPLEAARRWEAAGAGTIHVVDLDGARAGRPVNLGIVRGIVRGVKAGVELGGGIRDEASVKACVDAGVSKVVVGTGALDEKFMKAVLKAYGARIVVGIDAYLGKVATKGWADVTERSAVELARKVESLGAGTVNYTDVSRDGMLAGPNIDSVTELIGATGLDIVLAGGVSSMDDIRKLKALPGRGLKGVIIGKALYEGRVDLREAIRQYGSR